MSKSGSSSLIRDLRERTGCGIKDCQEALKESNDDVEKAIEYLRKKGLADAAKKSGRGTRAGRIFTYIHAGNQIGIMLELNCETDFVANTEEFQELGRDLCMQVCAMSPLVVKREDLSESIIEREKSIYTEQFKADPQMSKKPESAREKIVEGRLAKFYQEAVLMEQAYVKDDKMKVEDLIKSKIATLKENIVIRKFARFKVGED